MNILNLNDLKSCKISLMLTLKLFNALKIFLLLKSVKVTTERSLKDLKMINFVFFLMNMMIITMNLNNFKYTDMNTRIAR